jgi:hypothetical protein
MRNELTAFAVMVLAGAVALPGGAQEKKGEGKETPLMFEPVDFPQYGGRSPDTEQGAKQKAKASKAKYDGKLVKVGGILHARGDAKGKKPYTIRVTFPLKRPMQDLASVFVDVDFRLKGAAPELKQTPKAGLIVVVVGRASVDAKGRLSLKDAKVLLTNTPPG